MRCHKWISQHYSIEITFSTNVSENKSLYFQLNFTRINVIQNQLCQRWSKHALKLEKEKVNESLLRFLRKKENLLGLLSQSRIATMISWSPALTDNFVRAFRIAFKLTSLDASWITTTVWGSVLILYLV